MAASWFSLRGGKFLRRPMMAWATGRRKNGALGLSQAGYRLKSWSTGIHGLEAHGTIGLLVAMPSVNDPAPPSPPIISYASARSGNRPATFALVWGLLGFIPFLPGV